MGVTSAEVINREIASILECASQCRRNGRTAKSLAIPVLCVLKYASVISSLHSKGASKLPMPGSQYRAGMREIACGLVPALQHILGRERAILERMDSRRQQHVVNPDTHSRRQMEVTDPMGDDYFCKICSEELGNCYLHCRGCEQLLERDFNVCSGCYIEGKYKCFRKMHPTSGEEKHFSDVHHTGDNTAKRACTCKRSCDAGDSTLCAGCTVTQAGRPVPRCKKCSCTCHQVFDLRYRFFKPESIEKFLNDCVAFANNAKVTYKEETLARLNGEPMVPWSETEANESTTVQAEPSVEDTKMDAEEPVSMENEPAEEGTEEAANAIAPQIAQEESGGEETNPVVGKSKVFDLEKIKPPMKSN